MNLHMQILITKLAMFFLLVASLPGTYAQMTGNGYQPVEDVEKVIERLNKSSREIFSIKSRFTQKKQLDFLDETIVSKGSFWFRKENSLRWAYTEPFEYVILLNAGKFTIIDGSSVNEYDIDSNAAFREINDLIIGMVQGRVLEQGKFEIEVFENGSSYLVKLVPRDPGIRKVISGMDLTFDLQDLAVTRIVMYEGEKDYTVITFTDKRFNETIPDTIFSADM